MNLLTYQKGAKKAVYLLLSLFLLNGTVPAQVFATPANESHSMEEVIITFKTDQIDQSLVHFIQQNEGVVTMKPEEIHSISAIIPSFIFDEIEDYSTVKWIEKDSVMTLTYEMSSWGISKTKAPVAWGLNYTGKDVKVAVLDTGISAHEDLVISGGVSKVSTTSSYADDHGHGTHVAGIIGAKHNGIGTIGVAPDTALYAVKVANEEGTAYISDIISGIDWSIANNMDIINMSLGSETPSPALKDAITRAVKADILVVAAAGNDGNEGTFGDTVNYPARFDEVIAVSATNYDDKKAFFSSTGPAVDIAAPGDVIFSTIPNNDYTYMSGTSMASPYVAGILALYKEAYPTYNAKQLEDTMKRNAIDLGPPGKDNAFGVGLVQAPIKKEPIEALVKPSVPLKFTSKNVTASSATLAWDKVKGATRYELKRNNVVIYTGEAQTFSDKKLAPGVTYTYSINAQNTAGKSKEASIHVTTPEAAPTKPILGTVKVGQHAITLAWKSVANATSYEVKRNEKVIYEGENLTFTHKNLKAGTNYTYTITAKNKAGTSSDLTITRKTIPDTPPNLKGKATKTSNTISWDSVKGTSYYVLMSNGKQLYKGTNTSYAHNNLSPGVAYNYTIYAGNASGISPVSSTLNVTTLPKKPTTPVISKVTATQNGTTLTWKSVTSATSYIVKRNGQVVYEGTKTTFTNNGLKAGTSYTYEVAAKNKGGTSPFATVKKITRPASVTNLKVKSTKNSHSLEWAAVKGATSYEVKVNNKVVYQGKANTFTHKGLISGKTATYIITAGNASGTSSPVSIKAVTKLR